ncbi:MAG: NUDIX domain-containing protein [Gammaproteobacteria bacterium]|nr:NUDIX domain-containing protein [Gammaproteobacteria bacterium]
MPKEIFDIVDEYDQVIGQLTRAEVHRLRLRHRAIHILVFNRKGKLFLQKRSQLKDCNPGVWCSSVSGHVDSGETYDDCTMREAYEELGLKLDNLPTRLFKINACAETGEEFVWVYRYEAEGPFILQSDEIDDGAWFDAKEIDDWIVSRPGGLSSSLRLIWRTLTRMGVG